MGKERVLVRPNFYADEFGCGCGCGLTVTDDVVLDGVQEFRERLGRAVVITSGARCPSHNVLVGGRPDSQHVQGKAVDCVAGVSVRRMYNAGRCCEAWHFGGIGIYPEYGMIHLDNREGVARWGMVGGVFVSFAAAWKFAEEHLL